jgi:hypothetical protein
VNEKGNQVEIELTSEVSEGTDIIQVEAIAKGGASNFMSFKVTYFKPSNFNQMISNAKFEQTVDEIAFELNISLQDLEFPVSY